MNDQSNTDHTTWPGSCLEHLLLEADCCMRGGRYYVGTGELMDQEDNRCLELLGENNHE